jgi:tetratricopeptide (TPR) repeat protein
VAAEIYWNRDQLDDWAREEHNLGNTWCELPEKRFPGKWLEAITHYEKALVVRARERDRERHAATLQNLGTAYRELPAGDRTENVVRAIHCYRRAIGIYRFATFPMKNAGLHNNLGNAYLSLPFTGEAASCRNALRALRHLDRALCVRTRTAYPCDYAITQYNRGQALQLLAATDARAEPGMAAKCFEEAYECFLQCGQSEYGQMVLRRLGQLDGHRTS